MSDKQKILAGLLRHDLPAGNIDFRNLLSRLAVSELGKEVADADTFADLYLTKYWNWIQALLDEKRRGGIRPYFFLPNGGSFSIACASLELCNSSDDQSQVLGAYLKTRSAYLRQIDALDDRAYEALAVILCQCIGANHVVLTPPGNEGGIDFFAEIAINGSSPKFSSVGSRIRVVGQCKKYASPLAVDKFEQFLMTLQNVRHRSDRVRRHVPTWFNDSTAPIIGWMISHSGFQTGSSDEAKQHGVFLADSLDIAEILCHSGMIDPSRTLQSQITIINEKCQALL